MTMTPDRIHRIFFSIRESHVAVFSDAIECHLEDQRKFQCEEILRDALGKISLHGDLQLPTRVDFFYPQSQTFKDTQHLALTFFRPFKFLKDETSFHLSSFSWDQLQISLLGDRNQSFRQLKTWYHEWFLTRRLVDEPYYSGAVHSLSRASAEDDLVTFQIDLGTAPIDALIDLMAKLGELDLEHIALGNANEWVKESAL